MSKKNIEDQINEALELWGYNEMKSFLMDIIPLFELYDVSLDGDWVKNEVGEGNEQEIRLIRTVYLISKIAEHHAGKLCSFKVRFPSLYRRMNNVADATKNIR